MRRQEFIEYLSRLEKEEGRQAGLTTPGKPSEGKMRVLEELRALKFEEEEKAPWSDPDEASDRTAEEEVIGFHRNLPPFRARRMDWRRFPRLAQKTRIPPPNLSVLPELPERLAGVPWSRGGRWPIHSIDPDTLQ